MEMLDRDAAGLYFRDISQVCVCGPTRSSHVPYEIKGLARLEKLKSMLFGNDFFDLG